MRLIRAAAAVIAAAFTIAAAPNWTATVTAGEGGSHILGNPKSEVRVTEFLSYTCSHCANFHKESDAPLKTDYIRGGKVSLEVRHLVRDPVDLAAALLANCGDPKLFFGNHAALLSSQGKWLGKVRAASAAQQARWTSGPLAARMKAIAGDAGFYALMEPRGYGRAALDRCLGDEAMARRLTAQTEAGLAAGVDGTPAFMLNGTLLAGTHDWKSLGMQIAARF